MYAIASALFAGLSQAVVAIAPPSATTATSNGRIDGRARIARESSGRNQDDHRPRGNERTSTQ
jgi:hypothetical protein